jgi:GTPase SAR1 family protein
MKMPTPIPPEFQLTPPRPTPPLRIIKKLNKLLNKMSDEQLRQYFTLLALFNIPEFSVKFMEMFDRKNSGYLSNLVYSLSIVIAFNFNTHDLALGHALYHAHGFARARIRTHDLALDRDRAHNLALALNLALDLAHALDLDLNIDSELALGLGLDFGFNLEIAKLVIADSDFDSRFSEMWNSLSDIFNGFLHFLHKGESPEISAWAYLFEKMLNNNLKLEPNEIEALLALQEKDIDATVAESSVTLYSYLKGGFSDKYEMRLVILGEKGHGKTAFRKRFVNLDGDLPKLEDSTEGVDFETYKIPNTENDVTIKFWDFAGDTVTHEAHKYFLTERAVYVIVYGSRKEEEGQITKWLEHIKDFANFSGERKPKVFILVNLLRDAEGNDVNVTINEEQLKQNYQNDFDLEFGKMNLKEDNEADGNIYKFRKKIEDYILSLDTKVPSDYAKIDEKLKAKNSSFLSVSEVEPIIREVMEEYSKEILQALHKFAFFFYYGDNNEIAGNERVILDPEWITHAVYKVIRYAHKMNGVITRDDIENALNQDVNSNAARDREKYVYKRESQQWIENTLEHFQIAYKKGEKFVFPMCLPMNYAGNKTTLQFDEKNSFQAYLFITQEGTELRTQFPKDIVSSVIINNNECLVEEDGITLATRTYARFKSDNDDAVVEIKRVDDFMIYILGQGGEYDRVSIVKNYAEKLQKCLSENYSRFKREMPAISVSYDNKTIRGVSINTVYQMAIENIQNGFSIKKETAVVKIFDPEKEKELYIISEIKKQFDELKKTIKDESNDQLERMEELLDSFMQSVNRDPEKAKSKLEKFLKRFSVTADIVTVGVPLIDLVEKLLRMLG